MHYNAEGQRVTVVPSEGGWPKSQRPAELRPSSEPEDVLLSEPSQLKHIRLVQIENYRFCLSQKPMNPQPACSSTLPSASMPHAQFPQVPLERDHVSGCIEVHGNILWRKNIYG